MKIIGPNGSINWICRKQERGKKSRNETRKKKKKGKREGKKKGKREGGRAVARCVDRRGLLSVSPKPRGPTSRRRRNRQGSQHRQAPRSASSTCSSQYSASMWPSGPTRFRYNRLDPIFEKKNCVIFP